MDGNDLVTLVDMGHVIEIRWMEKSNHKNHIVKLDKDRYVYTKTGEILFFEHTENRAQGVGSMRRTFKKIRYLINNNFGKGANELWITLTYAENMQDTKKLYSDMNKFIKRIRYQKREMGSMDYLAVVEPQKRGAWHIHMLMKFSGVTEAYIANKELAEIWGHGFVTVKRIKNIDNLGAYITAYLTDLTLEEGLHEAMKGKPLKEVGGKAYVKGARVHLYPPGMNIYRASRGIKMPEQRKMRYKSAKEKAGSGEPTYRKESVIKNGDFESYRVVEEYNLRRQKNQ